MALRAFLSVKVWKRPKLSQVVELLSRKPDSIKNEGGLSKALVENNISHIMLDQKVYVAMDKDHKIMSSLDISDDQITQFLASAHPELARDQQKLQELARDPEWLTQTFQTELSRMMAQKETLSGVQLSENLTNMMTLIDKMTGSFAESDRNKISQNIVKSLTAADPAVAEQMTTQNLEHLFGGLLLQFLTSELAGVKSSQVKTSGSNMIDGQDHGEPEAPSGEYRNRLLSVSGRLCAGLKNEKTLLDAPLMSVLPKIIEQLVAQKEQEAVQTIIEGLVSNLFTENSDVRAQAASSLADIIQKLPPENKKAFFEKYIDSLLAWIKQETLAFPAYERMCDMFKNFMQEQITLNNFSSVVPVLKVFNDIHSGYLEKNDKIQEIVQHLVQSLAAPEIISPVLKEFNTNANSKRHDAGLVLAGLGNTTLEFFLDLLRDKSDSNERVNIMHLIIDMGKKVEPAVRNRIQKDTPWYYLRNLAYLLGQIGNEDSAEALQPLLRHDNSKLRNEALKSIYRVGGARRGQLLMAALREVDEEFKLNILENIGAAKAADIVPDLLQLLKNRPLVASASRTALEEKICNTLAAIGNPDAIPGLSEIAETSSFFRVRAYSDKVKAAASRALVTLRRKLGESGPQ